MKLTNRHPIGWSRDPLLSKKSEMSSDSLLATQIGVLHVTDPQAPYFCRLAWGLGSWQLSSTPTHPRYGYCTAVKLEHPCLSLWGLSVDSIPLEDGLALPLEWREEFAGLHLRVCWLACTFDRILSWLQAEALQICCEKFFLGERKLSGMTRIQAWHLISQGSTVDDTASVPVSFSIWTEGSWEPRIAGHHAVWCIEALLCICIHIQDRDRWRQIFCLFFLFSVCQLSVSLIFGDLNSTCSSVYISSMR